MMQWKDPPPPARTGAGRKVFAAEAAELRANPGRWAILQERRLGAGELRSVRAELNTRASFIRTGRFAAFRGGTWEAAVRTEGDVVRLYVRFTGEN